jgi:ATP-dependent Clp protease, protease subunit
MLSVLRGQEPVIPMINNFTATRSAQPGPVSQIGSIVYVSFMAEIIPSTSEALLRTMSDLTNQGVTTVHLLLSTLGGSVMHGMTLYNTLRALPLKLITHNVGSVNSIGNVVFLAGEERYSCPNATFMFHGVGFDVPQGARFEEKLLRERLDSLTADQARIAKVLEERGSFTDTAEIRGLFLEAVTKDPGYAKAKGLIHDIRDVRIPTGAPVVQLVFQR